ncbi:MAG: hypothetical protein C0622_03920 [Desulfuromonas sp.]|nr:MAG: hypothetical protein C0622_03920 [Desulfuromonas sp.]
MRGGGLATFKHFFTRLIKTIFPPACPVCLRTLPYGWSAVFCASCQAELHSLPASRCSLCALPFASPVASTHLCGRCLKTKPHFFAVYAVGLYDGTLQQAIQQLKFNQKIALDRVLGGLLAAAVAPDLAVDLVVPVPLEGKRLRRRGYNQALLLAHELARLRGWQLSSGLLIKSRETPAQQQLSARERERNLQGVFHTSAPLNGETVLLVDDVMTTGSTVSACARELLSAGAGRVGVAIIARAAR